MKKNRRISKDAAQVKRHHGFLTVFSRILAVILIFMIGFCAGIFYNARFIGLDFTDRVAEETAVTEISPEQQKLEELKSEFVQIFGEKYPSVDLSFAIRNMDTDAYVVHNDKQMNSASVIKLFILETVYKQLAKGEYELTDDKKEQLGYMITESNNPASNLFIDDFGGENEERRVTEENIINKTIKEQGYMYTELNRKMYDTTPPHGPSKYENYTSATDVCRFFESIYNKTLLEEPYNTDALELLKKQTRTGKIPAKIKEKYPEITVANKTGELSTVENDAAIIMCDDFNLAFVVLTGDIPRDSDGDADYKLKEDIQETISDFGLKLVELYKSDAFPEESAENEDAGKATASASDSAND